MRGLFFYCCGWNGGVKKSRSKEATCASASLLWSSEMLSSFFTTANALPWLSDADVCLGCPCSDVLSLATQSSSSLTVLSWCSRSSFRNLHSASALSFWLKSSVSCFIVQDFASYSFLTDSKSFSRLWTLSSKELLSAVSTFISSFSWEESTLQVFIWASRVASEDLEAARCSEAVWSCSVSNLEASSLLASFDLACESSAFSELIDSLEAWSVSCLSLSSSKAFWSADSLSWTEICNLFSSDCLLSIFPVCWLWLLWSSMSLASAWRTLSSCCPSFSYKTTRCGQMWSVEMFLLDG